MTRRFDLHDQIMTQTFTPGRLSRRRMLRLTGGLGLATAGLALGGRLAGASGTAPGRAAPARFQDAAKPPVPGLQPDGTRIWRVLAGGMDMEHGLDLQAFFPGEITINAGDSIYFDNGPMPGAHTITFGAKEPPAFIIPDPDGAKNADGTPQMVYNPAAMFPAGGPEFDGASMVNSGVAALMPPGTYFVPTFTTPGTYDYICVPHAGVMKGKVTVQERGAKVPHEQADYDQMATEQLAQLTEEGKTEAAKCARATVAARGDGTTLWEATAGAGAGQAKVQLMLPGTLEIKVGDTVRWVLRSADEPHTVTFANGVEPPREPIIEPQANGAPRLLANPQVIFPAGGATYSGKGYVNSGFLGKAFGGPESYELTFDTPGEFIYYCVLHGDATGQGMAGKVIVSAR